MTSHSPHDCKEGIILFNLFSSQHVSYYFSSTFLGKFTKINIAFNVPKFGRGLGHQN